MICELFNECPFARNQEFTENYCCKSPFLCARRRVAITVESDEVPDALRPDQFNRVFSIISIAMGHEKVA